MEIKVKLVEWFDDHWYKIELEDFLHDYFASTTTILGVTSKPFLAHWRGDIGNREADLRMNEAGDRGSRLHNAWCILNQGGAVIYQPYKRPLYSYDQIEDLRVKYCDLVAVLNYQEEMYQLTKLERWIKAVKPFYTLTEQIVYSLSNKRAGTADNVFGIEAGEYSISGSKPLKLERGLYVADLKSGKQVDDDAYMQTADYMMMIEEMAENGVEWAKNLIEEYGKFVGSLIIHTGSKNRSGIEGLATLLRTREQLEQDFSDLQHADKLWRRKNKDAKPTVFEFPSLLTLQGEENVINT